MIVIARVLEVSDLHLRDVDFTTIGGYVAALDKVLDDIERVIIERQITHVILLGDVTDKGYRDIAMAYYHRNRLEHIRDMLSGGLYEVVGNHPYLERDTNPEMFWIQPNERFKTSKPFFATRPVIEAPDHIDIGCVRFSLMHFNKEDKTSYYRSRGGKKYHHALFHDDIVLPSDIRTREHATTAVSNEFILNVFATIDSASCGHIHTPYGARSIRIGDRTIPIYIPGSLAIVSSADRDIHPIVNLQLHTVTDNTFSTELIPFKTYAETLHFYKKVEENKAVKSIKKQAKQSKIMIGDAKEALRASLSGHMTDTEYLATYGLTPNQLEIYYAAVQGTLDMNQAVTLTFKDRTGGM